MLRLTKTGDTALMMAARTGQVEAVKVLLDHGAQVNAKETWGDTTALMWAVSEHHPAVVKMLIDHGADVNAQSNFVPSASGRGFEGTTPVAAKPASRGGVRQRIVDAADVCGSRRRSGIGAPSGGGRRRFERGRRRRQRCSGLAFFNGSYDVAEFLVDSHAKVNQADAQRFTPLSGRWIGAIWKPRPIFPGW